MGRKDHVYWDWLTVTKFVAAGVIVFGLGWMWQVRHEVVGAYTGDQDLAALQISPLTLSAATIPTDDEPSLSLSTPPDIGTAPLGRLAFVEPEVEEPLIAGGDSSLSGTVIGLADDDLGGVVLITRITDGGEAEISVPIQSDGSWESGSIRGGRYRIRAFVPALRASNESMVVFLSDRQSRTLSLRVTTPPQALVLEVVGPETPEVGSRSVIAITAGRQEVDAEGRSVLAPVFGLPVLVEFSPVVSLLSNNTALTDGGGAARFLVRCELSGTAAVTLSAGEQKAVLTIPPCVTPRPDEADDQGQADE